MLKARDIYPHKWKPVEKAVLCFVRDIPSRKILLIHKKRGLGAGLINAPGGRIESGEAAVDAAIREVREEVGLEVKNLAACGELYFQFTDGHSIHGTVFETRQWSGLAVETPEADPFWCDENHIPYAQMWADDSWWLPLLLKGVSFRGRFIFSGDKMLSMSIDAESENEEGIPRNMNGGVY